MSACYCLSDLIIRFGNSDPKQALNVALKDIFPGQTHNGVKIHILRIFDDAMDEVLGISHLSEDDVNSMSKAISNLQEKAYGALNTNYVSEFRKHFGDNEERTLRLIGHNVKFSTGPKPAKFDRDEFSGNLGKWLDEVQASDLPAITKDFLKIKIMALIRFIAACRGATDDQIRLRIKSLAADVEKEISALDKRHTPTLNKLRDALFAPIRSTRHALSLASDLTTAATIVAGAMLYLPSDSPQDTPRLLPPAQEAKSDQ